MTNVEDIRDKMSPERRRKIAVRTEEILAEQRERNEFVRQMALALAPVFAQHFLLQSETYSRMFAAQNTGKSHEELLKFQTGPLAQQILELTRNYTVFAADAFADHYFTTDDPTP